MAKLRNIVRVRTPTLGVGVLALGAAVAGYKDFIQAGCVGGEVLTYGIHDFDAGGNLIASEVGRGTYNAVFNTLARTTILASTNADAALNLSGNAHVFITAIAEDFDHTSGSILNVGTNTHAQIDLHLASVANPHATTAAQVGAPALVNPSVVGNFVSFSNIAGLQQDSGFSGASFEPALTKGNLTASSPLSFNNARQVIGGAAQVKLGVSVADRYLYSTNTDVWTEGTITSFGRSLIDDLDAAAARVTLGIPVVVGDISGTGIVGQVAEFVTDTKTLQAAKLIAPVGAILTLVNASAKSITFPGASNDTVALLATANVFTTTQTITPATDVVGLIINKSTTSDGLQFKSGATLRGGFDTNGQIFSYGPSGTVTNFLSRGAGASITSGSRIVAIGGSAANSVSTGADIFALGGFALYTSNGNNNVAIGTSAARLATGSGIVAIGDSAGYNEASQDVLLGYAAGGSGGAQRLCAGYQAGYNNVGNACVFLGFRAGYRQTASSNILLIDNQTRASEAAELTNSIIYGVMAATPGTQTLRLNAVTSVAVNTTTTNAPLIVADFSAYVSTGSTGFANGGGVAYTLTGETATDGTFQLMAQISAVWVDATNATRKAKLQFSAYDTAVRLGLEIEATGSAAIITMFGHTYLPADNRKMYWGGGNDMSIYYDGTNAYLKTDEIAASDFHITTGAAKTLVLDTPVYDDVQFPLASGKVPAVNAPNWEALTTNTSAYAFSVDDYIDLQADEPSHGWNEGTAGTVHVHFALKTIQNSGANRYAKFTVYLAIADVNGVWSEIGPYTAEKTIPNGAAALTHYLLDVGTATLTGYHLGMQIKARVKRIAATGGTEYADDVFITQIGIHTEKVRLGSRSVSAA